MHLLSRILARSWILALICSGSFVVWVDYGRVQRLEMVSHLSGRAETPDVVVATSPTGYANGQRELIVPERSENSFHLIMQTQQMLAQKDWRVRRVDYDNAPEGRAVSGTSPTRWWLGLVAWSGQVLTGQPLGLSVEWAALYAGPVLHVLLLVVITVFTAWWLGSLPAVVLAIGLAGLFPLAAGFLPGVPDYRGLATACALLSILPLIAGLMYKSDSATGEAAVKSHQRRISWGFALAGFAGGLGVWVSVPTQIPVLLGLLLGAIFAGIIGRQDSPETRNLPWRLWGLVGAITVFVFHLVEYFPDQLASWRFELIHPLYGLAWLGAAELLVRVPALFRQEGSLRSWKEWTVIGVAVAAVAVLPLVMWHTGESGFWLRDPFSARLTSQAEGVTATSLWAWLLRDGLSSKFTLTLLPFIGLIPAFWLLGKKSTKPDVRTAIAVTLGPVLVLIGLACRRLDGWIVADAALLVLLVPLANQFQETKSEFGRWFGYGLVGLILLVGIWQLLPQQDPAIRDQLTSLEARVLIERDLAHWLARHREAKEGDTVYAPPSETLTLGYYGGLRGLGTLDEDNRDGLRATITIASAGTLEEAKALLESRNVRYLIIPSWDPFFDEYAQHYLASKFSNWKSAFIAQLRSLDLPPWLRALPYQIPKIGGFENQSAVILEVVDEQAPAIALGRLAEYLVETGNMERAAIASQGLGKFNGDVGALVARAQVALALEQTADFSLTLNSLRARLNAGGDRYLPWDRRVSLAIVLARGGQIEMARGQVQRCLKEIDRKKIQSLTTGSLYGLLVLSRAMNTPITDPGLNELALSLLPIELRNGL